MPGRDGTGPMGMGPLTGWGTGRCDPAFGYRAPYGCAGYGRGRCRRTYYTADIPYRARFDAPFIGETAGSDENKMDYLKMQAEYLEKQLQIVNKRLAAIKQVKE